VILRRREAALLHWNNVKREFWFWHGEKVRMESRGAWDGEGRTSTRSHMQHGVVHTCLLRKKRGVWGKKWTVETFCRGCLIIPQLLTSGTLYHFYHGEIMGPRSFDSVF